MEVWNMFEKSVGRGRTKAKQVSELIVSRVVKPEGKEGSRYQPCGDKVYACLKNKEK